MYERKPDRKVDYKCDRCNTGGFSDLSIVRVANIFCMEICDGCIKPTIEEIQSKRSPEAIAWYDELEGESRKRREQAIADANSREKRTK